MCIWPTSRFPRASEKKSVKGTCPVCANQDSLTGLPNRFAFVGELRSGNFTLFMGAMFY